MKNTIEANTLLAHAGYSPDAATGAVVPPIIPATTFARDDAYQLADAYSYARSDHPSAAALESLLTRLDGSAASLAFASGMSAIVSLLELAPAGSRVAAPRVMYHGTRDWLMHLAGSRELGLDWYDAGDDASLAASVHPGQTSLVWSEIAVNPTWEVTDLARAARVAHAAGARLAVDATVAPPVTCQPLALGADFVFQSATKYLNGHSDVTAGVVGLARAGEDLERMRKHRMLTGTVPGAFDCWLLMRGLRTLALRFERASDNALAVAHYLHAHDAVDAVLYPGLPSHPQHAVAAQQMHAGFGGMLSVRLKGGAEAALRVAGRLQLFLRATSLGGVESLVEHRATVEGPDSPVPVDLLRLSIGIEAASDLIADLEQALAG